MRKPHHIPDGGAAGTRAVEEQLRLAVEAGQLGIWDWDIPNDRVSWSPRVYELHGIAPGGFGGRVQDFAALVHPDDGPRVQASIEAALQGNAPYEVEFRVPLPEGRTRWLATRAEIVRDKAGKPVRMVGATYDITSRVELLAAERKARAAAEQARQRLELLATAGTMFSRSLDPHATLEAIASLLVPGVCDWCRVDLMDQHGVLQRALTHHADPEKARFGTELVSRLRAAPGAEGSMSWVVQHGRSYLAHFDPPLQFDPLRDKDLLTFAESIGMTAYYMVPLIARGRTLGALGALQAESGRKISQDDCALISEIAQRAALALDNARLYADAEAARRQAETANRAKDEFLAMLGHELRNPLAPIVTALHLMEMRGDGGTAGERRIIERQVAYLSRLVDDLLDVSRITQGKIQLERARVDMRAIVARALELTQPAMEKRLGAFDVDLPQGPVYVHGDAVRLVQILCNLLTNAAKFTPPEGRISLRLKAPAEPGDPVEVAVQDAGAGIGPDLLPHVFDLFLQGEQPSDRKGGGLGLGLAIVKTLASMHGGTVTAQSAGPGKGSTFTVGLPVAEKTATPVPEDSSGLHAMRGSGRVLIVDDNADAAQTLAQLLAALGYTARSVGDGPAALAALDDFKPDMAILDIGLPGMDGYELARVLRADARVPNIKLVALTGYGSERDRGRALAAEFDEHLVKPASIERLLDAINGMLQRK